MIKKIHKTKDATICFLGLQGIIITICIDDFITLVKTYDEYLKGSIKVIKMFLRLVFLIHPDRSTFLSSQEITYLGFILTQKNVTECNR